MEETQKDRAELVKGSFDGTGKLNRYTCEKCHSSIITIDREHGVTPFTIMCMECKGFMTSAMYRGVIGTPTFEWRVATPEELEEFKQKGQDGAIRHHESGGLFLHPIKRTAIIVGPDVDPDPDKIRDEKLVETMANYWGLKKGRGGTYYGPNPITYGSKHEGFCLKEDGSAYDVDTQSAFTAGFVYERFINAYNLSLQAQKESSPSDQRAEVYILIRSKDGKNSFKEPHTIKETVPMVMAYLSYAAACGQGVKLIVIDIKTKTELMKCETAQLPDWDGTDLVAKMKAFNERERAAFVRSGGKI